MGPTILADLHIVVAGSNPLIYPEHCGMKLISAFVLLFLLSGCASLYKPVPEGYSGPTATISDSGITEDVTKAQMFVVASIDGNTIANSLGATRGASYGQGPVLTTRFISRQIQARPQRVKLIGTHITAAPIVALLNMAAGSYLSVEGEVEFSPLAGGSYTVIGKLGKNESSVWIEDARTSERVTEIVKKK